MSKISRFVNWLCSKFTKSEIEQIVQELTDVLNNRNPEIKLKDEIREHFPHYQNFLPDLLPPLSQPELKTPTLNWKQLLQNYKSNYGKEIKPIKPKKSISVVPSNTVCRTCDAPHPYLYFNDGIKRSQIKCKICNSLSQVNPAIFNKAKFLCPYCSSPLQFWKQRSYFIIYRCVNDSCPNYITNLRKLNPAEKLLRALSPVRFKLRYHFREFHFSNDQLQLSQPAQIPCNLTHIRNSLNTLVLALTFHISFALSARKTALILNKVFQIPISYQTVLNYAQIAAFFCHKFNLTFKGSIDDFITGDEAYIKILAKRFYAFFFISAHSRASAAYHLHHSKDVLPATIAINEAVRTAAPNQNITAVTDGNPAYIEAVNFINRTRPPDNPITHKLVIGLQNLDSVSTQFRPFKQLIERFNRTFKHHINPAYGFNNFNGAIATTVLFVTHYNFLRPHAALNFSVPIPRDDLINIPTFQGQWAKILQTAFAL